MLVGIMSMQRVVNHGSFLQAMALKRLVESLGHEVAFIDFKPGRSLTGSGSVKAEIKSCIKRIYALRKLLSVFGISGSELTQKYEGCLPLLNVDPLKWNYDQSVDTLIIGSDEVFNCLQAGPGVGYSPDLFGKKADAQKVISYAASFGFATIDGIKQAGIANDIAGYLRSFDAISVRDNNSGRIVEELTGLKPLIHQDPVIVGDLEKLDWQSVTSDGFIGVYGYNDRFSESEGRAVRAFANKQGLRVVSLFGRQSFCDETIICGPDEIIPWFKSAEYIVTDTFHGTILSSITHTPMAVFVRSSNSNKLVDLLDSLNLTDRRCDGPNDLQRIMSNSVDFDLIEVVRSTERKRTEDYLSALLN